MRRVLAALVAALLVLTGCSAEKKPESRLPRATLDSFTGDARLDLATLKGPAVVNVWASWCTPCARELPLYQEFSSKHADDVRVIGVDFQDIRVDQAKALIERTGVTYPLYSDPDGKLRSRVLPQLLLVDAQGRVAFKEYVEITSVAQLEKLVRTHLGVTS